MKYGVAAARYATPDGKKWRCTMDFNAMHEAIMSLIDTYNDAVTEWNGKHEVEDYHYWIDVRDSECCHNPNDIGTK